MAIPGIAPYPMPAEHTLPVNVATWMPDPARAALLVHDMQRYFLAPFPADQQPAQGLLAGAAQLVTSCRELGVPVAYTAQPGDMSRRQRGLLEDFWGPGMRRSPEQQAIVEEVAPDADSTVFTKWRYSAFHNSGLMDYLRARGRDQLIVCGVYAHVGCLMTAVEAFTNDIETFLVADAVADFSEDHHRSALQYAAARCAVVLTTEAVLTQLQAREPAARA